MKRQKIKNNIHKEAEKKQEKEEAHKSKFQIIFKTIKKKKSI